MEIFLLRHGVAEGFAPAGDRDRRLTEEGREALRRVLERAHGAGVRVALILSSPYRRALETAEIAAHELGYGGRLVRTAALTPDSTPAQVWDEIRRNGNEEAILLCGHEPLFSATVAFLLGSSQTMVQFPPGALVRIDVASTGPAPSGVLRWMLTAGLA